MSQLEASNELLIGGGSSVDNVVGPDTRTSDKQILHSVCIMVRT